MKFIELLVRLLSVGDRSLVVRYAPEFKCLMVHIIQIKDGRRYQVEEGLSLFEMVKHISILDYISVKVERLERKMEVFVNEAEKEKAKRQKQD